MKVLLWLLEEMKESHVEFLDNNNTHISFNTKKVQLWMSTGVVLDIFFCHYTMSSFLQFCFENFVISCIMAWHGTALTRDLWQRILLLQW